MEDPDEISLVRMTTQLAHERGLSTVSEGVETEGQLDALRELGSDYVQGYHIARPMPADDLPGWAASRSRPEPTQQQDPPGDVPVEVDRLRHVAASAGR